MFNIFKRVYVVSGESEFHDGRFIVCDSTVSSSIYQDYPQAIHDPDWDGGCLFNAKSIDDLASRYFNGDIHQFIEHLGNETDLKIYMTAQDYIRMLAFVVLGLKKQFGLSQSQAVDIIKHQQINDFVDSTSDSLRRLAYTGAYVSVFDQMSKQIDYPNVYKNLDDLSELPLELVLYLFNNGLMTKKQVNKKLERVLPLLASNEIKGMMHSAKIAVLRDPTIVADMLGTQVTSREECISAIAHNYNISDVLLRSSWSLTNAEHLAAITKVCYATINANVGRGDSPDKLQARYDELNQILQLFQTPTYDQLMSSKQLIPSLISMLDGKFNKSLLIATLQ